MRHLSFNLTKPVLQLFGQLTEVASSFNRVPFPSRSFVLSGQHMTRLQASD